MAVKYDINNIINDLNKNSTYPSQIVYPLTTTTSSNSNYHSTAGLDVESAEIVLKLRDGSTRVLVFDQPVGFKVERGMYSGMPEPGDHKMSGDVIIRMKVGQNDTYTVEKGMWLDEDV